MGQIVSRTIFFCMLLAAACGPAPDLAPRPTPRVITIQVTAALDPLRADFAACATEQENLGLVVHSRPSNSLEIGATGFALRWGYPGQPEGFAVMIGQETLALIAHPSSPLQSLSPGDIDDIYLGQRQDIQPWAYPAGEDVQQVFETTVLEGEPVSRAAVSIAPDPAAMLQAISETQSALGFVPRRWLDERVKEITVVGLEPSRTANPLLAMRASEPQGVERAWLLCLQERLSE